MTQLTAILMGRLEKKGMERKRIPPFVRSFANILSFIPRSNLKEIHKWLNQMGWNEVQLDDQTLQLMIACLEAEGFID